MAEEKKDYGWIAVPIVIIILIVVIWLLKVAFAN